jgi:hypothetical protein
MEVLMLVRFPWLQEQIFKMVLRGHIDFKTDPWPKLSESAKDLVRRLLEQDPTKRATSQVRAGVVTLAATSTLNRARCMWHCEGGVGSRHTGDWLRRER